jgi:chromosome segregation ATPase
MASVEVQLRDSKAREQAAREQLRETSREFAHKDASLGAVEGEISVARRELAARDTALQTAERDLAALRSALAGKESAVQAMERDLTAARSELTGKDFALTRAEKEIVAIKAEIAALTTLLLRPQQEPPHTEPQAASARATDVIPLLPAAARMPEQPETRRLPAGLVPAPTRLIPPAIPQAQQHHDDGVKRAWMNSDDAGRRAESRHEGVNQRLRAIYAPLAKSTP